MTDEKKKELLKFQQGELDAVLMYNELAKAVKDPVDGETFKQLAKEEGKHAAIFKEYTGTPLKAKKTLAVLVPNLYRVMGKKALYGFIAKFEYAAAKGYEHLIAEFPDVEQVKNDETRHGDTVMGLIK